MPSDWLLAASQTDASLTDTDFIKKKHFVSQMHHKCGMHNSVHMYIYIYIYVYIIRGNVSFVCKAIIAFETCLTNRTFLHGKFGFRSYVL